MSSVDVPLASAALWASDLRAKRTGVFASPYPRWNFCMSIPRISLCLVRPVLVMAVRSSSRVLLVLDSMFLSCVARAWSRLPNCVTPPESSRCEEATGGRSQSPHAIVLRVVLDFSESQRFHHGWHIHSEAPAKALLQTVPTADWILWRSTPGFHGSVLCRLLLVRAPQFHPIAVLLERCVQIHQGAQMIAQLRLADRDHQRGGIPCLIAIRLELRRPWRRFQSPRLSPRTHAFDAR